MPPTASGRIVKPQRPKKPSLRQKEHQQQHQRNHRWESFSSKIAKLNSLDPLHKVRRHDLDDAATDDLSATTSYFRNGLERWTDLNLSRGFTAFRRAVSPLSDSLAQILHFEDRIMDALAAAIQQAQGADDGREALEPLLDLLTAFAHDLGARFVARGYDARAFALLVDVARHNRGAGLSRTHHQQNHVLDAAVLEWTFACLAFLFKYLARLLVPDLRPTYDILAPLLGRPTTATPTATTTTATSTTTTTANARVPGHIARFTAEALSFLVRMAANVSRRETALPLIVHHVRDDLLQAVAASAAATAASSAQRYKLANAVQLYTQGVMALFAEASKGPSETLRLSAAELYVSLLRAIPERERCAAQGGDEPATPWSDVCCGVLTSLVHHASPEALQALIDAIVADAAAATRPALKKNNNKKNTVPLPTSGAWRLALYVRLIGVLAGVRGGAKIKDWSVLVLSLSQVLEAMASGPANAPWPADTSLVWRHVVANVAILWHRAPMADLRPQVDIVIKNMDRCEPLARWFIPFCAYMAELDPGRFHTTLQAPFQAFVTTRWSHEANEDVLCAVLPTMRVSGAFPAPVALSGGGNGKSQRDTDCLRLPQSWQDHIVIKFEQLEATPFPERGVYGKDPDTWREHCLPKYAALLRVLDLTVVHPATPARIAELLLRKLKLALRPTSPQLTNNDETVFIVTQGFQSYLRMTHALGGKSDPGLRPLLRAAAPRFARLTGFLQALLEYEKRVPNDATPASEGGAGKTKHGDSDSSCDDEKESPDEDPFVPTLVTNLAAASHDLRLISLHILEHLGGSTDLATFADHSTALGNMLQTEQTDFAPQNVRSIAAYLRKLGQVYARVADGSWMQAAIPAFLFGMLSVPLAPVWDDAIQALKMVAEANKAGEDAVARLAFDWLDVPSSSSSSRRGDASGSARDGRGTAARLPLTDFECFKLDRLRDTAQQTERVVIDPSACMRQTFREKQEVVAAHAGFERGRALKVLAAMPVLAERRSRRLVPHLLSWTEDHGPRVAAVDEDDDEMDEQGTEEDTMADAEEEEEENEEDDDDDDNDDDGQTPEVAEEGATEAAGEPGGWSFPDKKALIVVFSQFTNAQVLYQSEKAYDALLKLLANGDIEIQRLALKGLLAWRQDAVLRYKETLDNLLDETKFKNELTLFLQADDNNSSSTNTNGIRPEHRADLMPVLLRLLYGRTISKKGAASGRQGLHATRLFVIRHLDTDGIGGFLQVALGNLQGVRVVDGGGSGSNSNGRLRTDLFPTGTAAAAAADDEALLTARKQVGVLNMLEPIINELGANITPFVDTLVNATLYCLISACRGLQSSTAAATSKEDDGNKSDADETENPLSGASGNVSLLRTAKTAALRCLCSLFRNAADFDWDPYRDVIVGEVISPVIDRLPQETTQGVSWTWKLLATWAQLPQCVPFLGVDARVLPKILESLSAKAKDVVKIFALGVVNSLVQLSQAPAADSPYKEYILSDLLAPNMDAALGHIHRVLRSSATDGPNATTTGGGGGGGEISRQLLEACVDCVVTLSPLVQESAHVRSLVDIATWLLNQPSRRVNPRVKGSLLLILECFICLNNNGAVGRPAALDAADAADAQLQRKVYTTIASLFSFFKDRTNRQTLCRVLSVFADAQAATDCKEGPEPTPLQVVSTLCFDLNAYAEGQVDDVADYDRRLAAFGTIARPPVTSSAFTTEQWLPLLHNMLFFVRTDEEYGILASNAADGLCKFIADAANPATHLPRTDSADYAALLKDLILPALYGGARDASDTVRREIARVFGFFVAALRAWPPVADLAPLVPPQRTTTTSGGDDDNNGDADATMEDADTAADDRDASRAFFVNILSPAISKQIQAMQVLEGVNARHALGSKHVSQFLIPLLEHFIFGREDNSDDRGLGAQATNTIAQLAYALEWNQYRAVLRRFLSFIESKPELQKQIVRLLDKVVDALAVSVAAKAEEAATAATPAEATTSAATVATTQDGTDSVVAVVAPQRRLAASLPDTTKLADEVLNNLTPSLFAHLHEKDETTVSARVPAAIILVKLLNVLPIETRDQKLPGVLTDVCHILRSKAWDARELARETLARIACILGPSCFGFILQELRGALLRGYQLHVLSYTLHTLLLAVIPKFAPGDLDYCLESIMAIVLDDVFGVVGQEKDADDYVSKMKEVKQSKSQDSLALITQNASVRELTTLVQPLHALMLERINKTVAAKIDTLLARIATGLAQNPAVAENRDALIFCYGIIQDVYKSRAAAAAAATTQTDSRGGDGNGDPRKADPRIRKFLFQKTTRNNVGTRQAGKFTYKLVAFALDVLRTVLRKHDSLRTPENVAGFIPVLGDAVVAGEEPVKIAAYKLLTVLVNVPFPTVHSSAVTLPASTSATGTSATMTDFTGLYQVCTKQAIKDVSTAVTTTTDLAQAALKLVSVVLRTRHKDVPVRSAAVDVLLGRLKEDLTNPLYRHVTFNFLRAVLDRQVLSAAVYDTLDYVATVMVTNDDSETRSLARRAYLQFLREYPQRRKRWARQLEFVVANFQYAREGGRLSALEVLYTLLRKATAALPSPAAAAEDDFVQDIVGGAFLPLVLVAANDSSAKCRRVAGAQLTAMLGLAKKSYLSEFLRMFREWLAKDANVKKAGGGGSEDLAWLKTGVEMFGFYFDAWDAEATPVTARSALTSTNIEDLQTVVGRIAGLLGSDRLRRHNVYDLLLTTALQTTQVLVTKLPVLALDRDAAPALWQGIQQCLWHRNHAVRMAAMRLVELYLSDFAQTMAATRGKKNPGATPAAVAPGTPITGSFGLTLEDDNVSRLVRGCLSVLSPRGGADVDEVEAEAAAKMLLHLGQYLRPEPDDDEGEDSDEDEEADEEDEEYGGAKSEEEKEEDESAEGDGDEGESEDETKTTADNEAGAVGLHPTNIKPVDRRYVILRLARIVRREAPPKTSSLVPKAAALAVLEAFCGGGSGSGSNKAVKYETLSPVAVRAVLRPLRNLTDTTIRAPFSADPLFAVRLDALKRRAQALMDTLQKRLGSAAYTRELLAVGAAMRDRRQQRASKRKIAAVAQPEKHGRDKRKKMEQKKARRKVLGQEHRGARRGY
ncbi:Down-regulated-in-metastasis protein [Niveomyces insectorum RCEF 264]|uniref:Down-regulated-in-metastasis protein n=1 Tax=Niveomyces insectorum RCEF 264 TaxID=1081102 RepID=A0A167Z2E8_9HYPO|nr:Down-regulated-in-metastasis protein [Niveomyces insectorum RCEF 264]